MRVARGRALVLVVILGCAGAGRAGEAPRDASLVQAQKDLDEAKRIGKAGKPGEAVPLIERALQIREKALGPDRPEVAECLDRLGNMHLALGNYTQAEPLLERALRIRESALGKSHPDVAQSLISLGHLYLFGKGSYERAEPLFQRALQIAEAALGKDHLTVAGPPPGPRSGLRPEETPPRLRPPPCSNARSRWRASLRSCARAGWASGGTGCRAQGRKPRPFTSSSRRPDSSSARRPPSRLSSTSPPLTSCTSPPTASFSARASRRRRPRVAAG